MRKLWLILVAAVGVSCYSLAEDVKVSSPESEKASMAEVKEWFSEGKKAYDAGEYEKAYELFSKAAKIDPENILLQHYLGLASSALGKHGEAIVAYDKALQIDPKHHPSRLEKGRALANIGDVDSAQRAFQRVLEADVPVQVRANAELYQAQLGGGVETDSFFSGIFILSNTWDSNASLGTGPVFLPSVFIELPASASSDRIFSGTLILNYNYPVKEEMVWTNSFVVAVSDNYKLSANDMTMGQLSSGVQYYLGKHMFSLTGFTTSIWVDQILYQSNVGGAFAYNYSLSDQWMLTASYTSWWRYHSSVADEDRSGVSNSWLIGATFIPGEKHVWGFNFTQKYDKTPEAGVDKAYYRDLWQARYTYAATPKVSINCTAMTHRDRYQKEDALFPGVRRRDRMASAIFGTSVKVRDDLMFDASLTYTDNHSNIDTSKYVSKKFAATLTYLF